MKTGSHSSISKCNSCGRQTDELYSGVKGNLSYDNICSRCVGTLGSAEFYRRWDRQYQRREYAQDILQPDDKDYAKVYGHDKARERGWTDEQIRRNT